MTQLDYLRKRLETKNLSQSDYIVLNSLILSLSSVDACSFFDWKFEQDYHVRHYLLRKISNDIDQNYLTEHRKIVSSLIRKIEEKSFNKKESCAYSLEFLCDSLPTRQRNIILRKFLKSKSIRNRDRAYKRISSNWNKKYQEIIEEAWTSYHDPNCLSIIIDHFSSKFLSENYKDLVLYAQPYQTSRLFLKLGTIDFELVHELKSIDQISYSYVLTKLNKKLTESQATEFLESNNKDERIGLLLWCIGKMGLWESIIKYDINKSKQAENGL